MAALLSNQIGMFGGNGIDNNRDKNLHSYLKCDLLATKEGKIK